MNERKLDEFAAEAAAVLAPLFADQGWKWAASASRREIPSEGRIALAIRRSICGLLVSTAEWFSSGRLRVMHDPDDGAVVLCLELGTFYPDE